MLKLTKTLILGTSLLLILAACGQGANPTNEEVNENTDTEIASANASEAIEEEENLEEEASEEEIIEEEANEPEEVDALVKAVTLYFSDQDLMNIYRVEMNIEVSSEETAPKETLQAWINGVDDEDLTNLLPEGVVVQSVEVVDGIAHVSFSKELLNANLGASGELFLLDQIAMTMEQFGFGETLLLIDGEVIPEFLGHMDTSEPIKAGSPDQYEIK